MAASLRRDLTLTNCIALVVANMVGTGIFTTTGFLADDLGRPLLVIGIWVVGAIVALAGCFAYAELGMNFPRSGGEYAYLREAWGPGWAFLSGWVSFFAGFSAPIAATALAFSAYLADYFPSLAQTAGPNTPGWHLGFNIPAFLIVMLLTMVLVRGIRESAETNNVMVLLKIAAILAFVFVGMRFIHPTNYHPFVPEGWSGVLTGGSIIFFTYIGFDSVSTAAEEARNPQRDLPIGIIATLIVCTVLYIAVAVVLTGLVPWRSLIDDAAPVVNSLSLLAGTTKSALLHWTELAVLFGAMMGMISSLLVFQLGQARVWFSMSRDGLLPKIFSRVHPRFRTPAVATWIAGFLVGIPGGSLDIGTLSDLSNIGTLFAFVLVSLGVIILRYKQPERHRGFRAPGGLAAPILSVLFCVLLMAGLPILTWLRFFFWLIIGMGVYWLYSRHRSEFSPRNANALLTAGKR